jgi:ATP-dependent protease ClpP protease subunit
MAQKLSNAPREWYRIQCQADAEVAEIFIYDEIGEAYDWATGEMVGVSAKTFLAEMQALPDSIRTLRIRMNSPGGNPFDGIAICNLIQEQARDKGRKTECQIDSLAASAATYITSACQTIRIAANALVMIHKARGVCIGSDDEMVSFAETLRAVNSSAIRTYQFHSKLSDEDLAALMAKTTWMNAGDALANGFATEIVEPVQVDAHFDARSLKALGEIPEQYRERVTALMAPPEVVVVPAGKLNAEELAKLQPAPGTVTPVEAAPPEVGAVKEEAASSAAAAVSTESAPATVVVAASEADVLAAVEAANFGESALPFARQLLGEKLPILQVTNRIAEAKEIQGLCTAAKLPEEADWLIRDRIPIPDVKIFLTRITAKLDKVEIITALPVDGGTPRAKSGINSAEIYRQRAGIAAHAREGREETRQ